MKGFIPHIIGNTETEAFYYIPGTTDEDYAIGEALGKNTGVRWLPSDFKKKDGYKRSLELSREYGLYREAWCGCGWPEKPANGE